MSATEKSDPAPAGRPARGLRGSLDLPSGAVPDPSDVVAAGWVFHEHAEVLLVVLTVDDRIVGTVARSTERPDVAAAHPRFEDAARSGWGVSLDLGDVSGRFTLGAHALVRTGRDGQPTRTVMLPFAERTLEVSGVRGRLTTPDSVTPGPLRVTGIADLGTALSRVEVALAGGGAVRARHSIPTRVPTTLGPEQALAGFSCYLDVPDGVPEVTVEAITVTTDGTRTALPPRRVAVDAVVAEPSLTEARQDVVRERLRRHVDALRGSAPRGGRVLVSAHDLGVGGAQHYLADLVAGLRRDGLELCVVAGSTGPFLEELEQEHDAPVLVTGPPPLDAETLETHLRLISGFAAEHGAAACVANTVVGFPAVLAAHRSGLPSMWALHESFTPEVFWYEYLGRRASPAVLDGTYDALAVCDEVMFVADATRRLYAPFVRSGVASLVPYGLDVDTVDAALATTDRAAARRELGIGADQRVLVCVGTVEPRKGQLGLARAFGRLDPALRADAALYVVGADDGAYSTAVRSFVADAGLENVHVVAQDRDIMRWYVAADVLVSASDVESMPRTMLEAMLASRPVAATAVFGVPELVEHGSTGWLCPAGDLGELTDMLDAVLRTPAHRLAEMGAAARAKILRDHDARGFVAHVAGRLRTWCDAPGEVPPPPATT